jgi:hypothetical protein
LRPEQFTIAPVHAVPHRCRPVRKHDHASRSYGVDPPVAPAFLRFASTTGGFIASGEWRLVLSFWPVCNSVHLEESAWFRFQRS